MKKTVIGLAFVCLAGLAQAGYATDLTHAFRDALQNDPTFKAAQATRLAQHEALPQAYAGFLPSLIGTGNVNANRQRNNNTGVGGNVGRETFYSHDFAVSLRQSLFSISKAHAVKGAQATARAADAAYRGAYQDLIIRVATAYFKILEAEDTLRFTESEKRANERQLERARQRFKVGLDAITSVYDAQAEYDAVVAQEIAAENNLKNAREALREITGRYYSQVAGIKGRFPLKRPIPNKIESWVHTATRQNFTYLQRRYQADAAKQSIGVSAATNLPTVDAVGSFTDRNNSRAGFVKTDTDVAVVGLQFNFPMYQGGLIHSQARQAGYNYKTALANLDAAYLNTMVTTRQLFNNIVAGIAKIKADRQAIVSAQSSSDSTEAAFKVGTRTIVDVLDAQRALFDVQRTLAVDQYQYINDTLALKQASGILTDNDLNQINRWLHETRRWYHAHKSVKPNSNTLKETDLDELNSIDLTEEPAVKADKPKIDTPKINKPEAKQPQHTHKHSATKHSATKHKKSSKKITQHKTHNTTDKKV